MEDKIKAYGAASAEYRAARVAASDAVLVLEAADRAERQAFIALQSAQEDLLQAAAANYS